MLFSHQVVSDSLLPHRLAHQAPLSMGFPRQEYWNGFPSPSPGDLPNSGIELMSPALVGGFFTTAPLGKPTYLLKTENPSLIPRDTCSVPPDSP